jgi:NDP-sugar pyrophosphorylase family protein
MMPAIAILAGGYATRLYPITKTIPKSMLEVAGKPFIAHQLDLLKRNDISRVVICAGYLSEQIEKFVGDGKKFGLSISFSYDGKKLLGTGGAIKKALPLLSDTFFVLYGDSYLPVDYKKISEYFQNHSQEGLMTVLRNNDTWDKSNLVFKNGKIINYDKVEKTREMEFIDYGLSLLRKSAFDEFGRSDVFDIGKVFRTLVEHEQMIGYEVNNRFYEIGSVQGLADTEEYILNLAKSYKEERA